MTAPALYVYKCVNDDGTAPCVDDGLFSLTICKPAIRRTAEVGSLIFAFRGNNQDPPNGLVYIAEVTQRMQDGRYFTLRKYRLRQDCIYRYKGDGELVHRKDKAAHSAWDHSRSDVGEYPDYQNAVALISSNFRYFGDESTNRWKRKYPRLRRMVEALEQGHRRPRGPVFREELLALKGEVWAAHPRCKVLGDPPHEAESLPSSCRRSTRTVRRVICSPVDADE